MAMTTIRHTEEEITIQYKFWVLVTILVFTTVVVVSLIDPSCVASDRPPESRGAVQFASTNARIHLQRVTSLGPRPAGSVANELLTPEYLRHVLEDICFQANTSGLMAVVSEHVSQYSSYQTHFHITSYNNLRNFVLRLHDPRTEHSSDNTSAFLVNCHYDSVVTSPGASDDFVSCAIMLEVARAIVSSNVNMLNDLVFLFNGAEESILPASHAFITQHPWSSDVVAFLNMEGVGGGGRLFVFQSGPGSASDFLMSVYSKTFTQPYGQVMAEELFQSGILQSDTDFRIFRDYGLIPGIDMAYTNDGYCYHTMYDTESRISDECLQNTGDDILRFLKHIIQNRHLDTISKLQTRSEPLPRENDANLNLSSDDISVEYLPKSKVQMTGQNRQVYFDILGLKLFVMSWSSWKLISWFVCSCVWVYLFIHRRTELVLSTSLQIVCQLLGISLAFLLGWVIRTYGCRMSWYSTRHNIVGIFILPFLCWNIWFHTYFFHPRHGMLTQHRSIRNLCSRFGWNPEYRSLFSILEQDFFDAALFILSLILTIVNLLDSRMVYIPTIWLGTILSGRVICSYIQPFGVYNKVEKFVITFLPIIVCHSYLSIRLLDFFIPLLGRAGQNAYPDITLSLLIYFILFPAFLFLAGPLSCTTRDCGSILRVLLLNACLSYAILVHASPYGFPYTVSPSVEPADQSVSPRYQRLGVFHNDRRLRFDPNHPESFTEESYIWIVPMDDNDIRYLKPNSYPPSVPSSLLSVIYHAVEPNTTKEYRGLVELTHVEPVYCNRTLPYCGVASIYPFIHRIIQSYHIPTTPHDGKPATNLRMVSRKPIPTNGSGLCWNYTFSVSAGPPYIQILLRVDTPNVRLISWSFNSTGTIPLPMPLPKRYDDHNTPTGAHYLISHINAAAVNESAMAWSTPWTFWIVLDSVLTDTTAAFDMAVVSIYTDQNLASGISPQLSDTLSRLPPWVVTMHSCTSYDHYRFSLL